MGTARSSVPRHWLLCSGLYALKPAFVARLRRVEDAAHRRGISANTVSVVAVVVAAATAVALLAGQRHPWLWLAVAPLCFARMACNAVDGSLARRSGTTSTRGAVLNEIGDRVADAVTFGALAPTVGVALALAVVLAALATSFVAVLGQAVLGERVGLGPLGKPDRVAVLSVAATGAAFAGAGVLTAGAWILVVAGAATAIRRMLVLWQRTGEAR